MGLTDVHTGLSELLELLNRLGLGSDGSNDRGLLEVERERRKGQELRWADQGEIEKEMGGGTYLSEELVLISESVEAGEGREEERERRVGSPRRDHRMPSKLHRNILNPCSVLPERPSECLIR